MEANFKNALNLLVSNRISLLEVSIKLKEMKTAGVEQDEVIEYLNSVRNSSGKNENVDNWVLEVLDIVTGYCNIKYKVW